MAEEPPPDWKKTFDVIGVIGTLTTLGGLVGTVLVYAYSWPGIVLGFSIAMLLSGIAMVFARVVSVRADAPVESIGGWKVGHVPTKKEMVPLPARKPESALASIGIDYIDAYIDDHQTFWEIRRGASDTQFYSAVLRLENEAVAGAPGREFNSLRARLSFRTLDGHRLAPVDRGCWVREEYNAINLPVGDHRGLIVAQGVPPGMVPPNGQLPHAYMVANNHYSPEQYNDLVFARLEGAAYLVDVRIISGDAGTIRFEKTFRLQVRPHLLLLEEA